MKTEAQIQAKIKEHERRIKKMFKAKKWDDFLVECIEKDLLGRKALLWVLNDAKLIISDNFERNAEWEITCYESTKIF